MYEIYIPVHLINSNYYDKPTWKKVAELSTRIRAEKFAEKAAEMQGIPEETIWIREPGEEVGFSD